LFYNPARLAAVDPMAGLSFQALPVGAGAGAFLGALPFGPGVLGTGLQYLNYGEIEVIEPDPGSGDEWGVPTGVRVDGGEVALSVAYGLTLPGRVEAGAAARLPPLRLAEAVASGASFDIGAALDLLDGRLSLGGAVQHLGRELGPGRASPLPRTFRLGAALRAGGVAGARATLVAEGVRRAGGFRPAGGVEAVVPSPGGVGLLARVGYDGGRGDGRTPLALGAGAVAGRIAVDYAYRDLGALGPSHLFGVTLRLGR